MSDGRKIEIRIAATGGDQAAGEIRKVEAAADDSSNSVERFGGRTNLAGAAGIGAAAGLKILGEQLGKIREGVASIDIENLRELSPEMAKQAEEMGRIAEWFTSPLDAMQRAISGTTVGEAFADMNAQLAAQAQLHRENVDRIITDSKEQTAALKALSDEIAAANKILDAKDAADAKARDRADAEAIRNGGAPEDVRAKRAADDAEKEIERINRGLVQKRADTNAAYDMIGITKGELGTLERDPKTKREDIEAAMQAVAAAEAAFARSKLELAIAEEVAAQQRRGVREGAAASVDGFSFEKQQRIERERQQAERDARAEQLRRERAERQVSRTHLSDAADKLDATARGDAGKFRNAGLHVGGELGAVLQDIAGKMADGTNEQEIAKLSQQFLAATQGFGGATISAMRQMISNQQALAKEVETLKSRLKKGRDGG